MFRREVTPADITGVRSVELELNSHTGELLPDQAMPASKNGEISSGGNALWMIPRPAAPNNGIRNSTFATPTRLPSRRSNSGHWLPCNSPVQIGRAHV